VGDDKRETSFVWMRLRLQFDFSYSVNHPHFWSRFLLIPAHQPPTTTPNSPPARSLSFNRFLHVQFPPRTRLLYALSKSHKNHITIIHPNLPAVAVSRLPKFRPPPPLTNSVYLEEQADTQIRQEMSSTHPPSWSNHI